MNQPAGNEAQTSAGAAHRRRWIPVLAGMTRFGGKTRARRTLRRLAAVVLAAVVLGVTAWATLPYWLPRAWLRARIVSALERVAGAPAEFGPLEYSRREGLVLRSVRVVDPTRPADALVEVARVRASFSPWAALWGAGLTMLEFVGPKVALRIDADGRLNLGRLRWEDGEGWPVRRVAVRDAEVSLEDARSSARTAIRIAAVDIWADPSTGRTRWALQGAPAATEGAGRFGSEATLRVPRVVRGAPGRRGAETPRPPAADDGRGLEGAGELRWEDVDLSSVPVWLATEFRGARLAGRCSGTIRATVGPNLDQEWELRADARDAAVVRGGAEAGAPRRVDVRAEAAGRWRPAYDIVEISRIIINLPGVRILGRPAPAAAGPAVTFSLRAETPVAAGLTVRIDDLAEAKRWLPGAWAAALERPGAEPLRGGAVIDVDLEGGGRLWLAQLAVHNAGLTLGAGWPIRLDPDTPASAMLEVRLDRAQGEFVVDSLAVRLGSLRIDAGATVPWRSVPQTERLWTGDWNKQDAARAAGELLQEFWRRGGLRVTARTEDLADTAARVPVLGGALAGWEASGAAEVVAELKTEGEQSHVSLKAEMPEEAVLRRPGTFEKRRGERWSLRCGATDVAAPDGLFRDLMIEARCGEGVIRSRPVEGGGRGGVVRVAIAREGDERAVASARPQPEGTRPGRYTVDVALRQRFEIERIEALRGLLGWLAAAREARPADGESGFGSAWPTESTGNATVELAANLRHAATEHEMRADLWRVSASIDAHEAEVRIGKRFHKPRSETARVRLDYAFDRRRAGGGHDVSGRLELDGGIAEAALAVAAATGGAERLKANVTVEDVGRLRRYGPWLEQLAETWRLQGGARIGVEMTLGGAIAERAIRADLTDLGIGDEARGERTAEGWVKRRGIPLRIQMRGRGREEPAGQATWEIDELEAVLAGCRLIASAGRVRVAGEAAAEVASALADGDWGALAKAARRIEGELTADWTATADATLASLSPGLARLTEKYDAVGRCDGRVVIGIAEGGFAVRGEWDGTRMNVRVPGVVTKPAGVRTAGRWEALARAVLDGPSQSAGWTVKLRQAELTCGEGTATAQGELRLRLDEETAIEQATGHLTVRSGRIEELGAVFDEWRPESTEHVEAGVENPVSEPSGPNVRPAAGEIEGWADVSFQRGAWSVRRARLEFDGLEAALRRDRDVSAEEGTRPVRPEGTPPEPPFGKGGMGGVGAAQTEGRVLALHRVTARVDGALEWTGDALTSDGLDVRMDELDATLAGRLRPGSHGVDGNVIVSGRWLDWPALTALIAGREDEPADEVRLRRLLSWLGRSELQMPIHIRRAVFPGLDDETEFTVNELGIDLRATAGIVRAGFSAAMNGGVLSGSFAVPATVQEPYFDLAYEARGLWPQANTRPVVESFFPGMEVAGRITLVDRSHQRVFAREGEPAYPSGSGEMVLEGGTIVGRAAPVWVTRMFPSLDMAQFEFERMVNRFEKHPDGTHDNAMTFFGPNYHLYAAGRTKADGAAEYEVGVDLLANVSPDLSRIGQGRVALFIKTGVIRRGVMEDEVVRYLTPAEVTRKILTNNVLTTAYYAVKKQVTGL